MLIPYRASLIPHPPLLHIQILDGPGVGLDETATRFHFVAHQDIEKLVGLFGILDIHLKHNPIVWIHRSLPKLFRVHFSETFVTLE